MIHSAFLEPTRRYWSMHRPDALSEQIVRVERERSYLRTLPFVPGPALIKKIPEAAFTSEIFDGLYAKEKVRIRGWAHHFFYACDPNIIEDVVQEVWQKVFQIIDIFTDLECRRTYLNRVAFTIFCARYTSWQTAAVTNRKELDYVRTGMSHAGKEATDSVSISARSAFQSCADDRPMLADEHRDDLAESLIVLTPIERRIVELHFSGLTYTQIGSKVGMAYNSVGQAYRRAADKMALFIEARLDLPPAKMDLGCYVTGQIPDGKRFGYLKVLHYIGVRRKQRVYRCRCLKDNCTREITIGAAELNRGTVSCAHHGKTGRRLI